MICKIKVLQIRAAGVGGSAENDHSLALMLQIRLNRILAHIGIDRYCIGPISFKGFHRVVLRSAANIPTFSIQNNRDIGVLGLQVGN